jgi:hypothetical protein
VLSLYIDVWTVYLLRTCTHSITITVRTFATVFDEMVRKPKFPPKLSVLRQALNLSQSPPQMFRRSGSELFDSFSNIILLRIFPLSSIYSWKMLRKIKWLTPAEPLAARYDWCQGQVPGRCPVEKRWSRGSSCGPAAHCLLCVGQFSPRTPLLPQKVPQRDITLFLRNIFLFSTHQNINGAVVAQLVQWLSHGLYFSVLKIVTDRPPEANPSSYSVGARVLTTGVNGPRRDVNHSSASGKKSIMSRSSDHGGILIDVPVQVLLKILSI